MTAARIGMGGANHDGAASDEWWTPPGIFQALGLEFDLDPCAPSLPQMPWLPARHRVSRPADGLSAAWEGRVWLNPPYGRQSGRWTARLASHGNGIALIFARTDTAWVQAALGASDAACFIAGRVSFIDATGHSRAPGSHNAAAPSVLLAFGHECARAVLGSGLGTAYARPLAVVAATDVPLPLEVVR